MSFEKFLNLEYFPDSGDKEILSWNNHLVSQDKFFQYLCCDKNIDWSECANQLYYWNKRIKSKFANETDKLQFDEQFKHAVKLFTMAEFADFLRIKSNNQEFSKIYDGDEKFFAEKNPYEFGEFKPSIHTRFPKLKFGSGDGEISLEPDEKVLLCSVFYSNSAQMNSREIPIVTALNNKIAGQVLLLELTPVMSMGNAVENPFIFPYTGDYFHKIEGKFKDTIKKALSENLVKEIWNSDITKLEGDINQRKEKLNNTNSNDKILEMMNARLELWKSRSPINRWGIVWKVKPYLTNSQVKDIESASDNKSSQEQLKKINESLNIPIDGPSIGRAALFGIYHTLRGNFPDNREVNSVAINTDYSNLKTEFVIVETKSIPAKIKAAINTKFIDTFVMHDDNFNENNKKKELENLIEGKNFRIKTIDSEGDFVKTYPKIRETPEESEAS